MPMRWRPRGAALCVAVLAVVACADESEPGIVGPPYVPWMDPAMTSDAGAGTDGDPDLEPGPLADGGANGDGVDPDPTGEDAGSGDGSGDGSLPDDDLPLDGDPSKPVVEIAEASCGPAQGLSILGQPNIKIGGRDVVLSYPCDKHEGAAVTFILNLHGTNSDETTKFYQHGYFAAHELVTSHNLIVATPRSVVSQWGNGDGGEDKPHLLEIIDWIYEKFAKFRIQGLWVGGHSWGSFYAKAFVCDEALSGRARGVIGMSGGTGGPGRVLPQISDLDIRADCVESLSQIHTVGDTDSVQGLPDQSSAASGHGCDAKTGPDIIGNDQELSEWPNCDPGWVHAEYLMGGHSHVTPIDAEVVLDIVEKIKATE